LRAKFCNLEPEKGRAKFNIQMKRYVKHESKKFNIYKYMERKNFIFIKVLNAHTLQVIHKYILTIIMSYFTRN
jgi:hypothetical protein